MLCQLSYCPPGAGAGPTRIAAAPQATARRAGRIALSCARRRSRPRSGAGEPGDQQRAVARGRDRGAADRAGVREPAAATAACGRAPRSAASVSAASVSPSRPGRRLDVAGAQQLRACAAACGSGRARPGSAGTSRRGARPRGSASSTPSTSAGQQRGDLVTPHGPRLLLRTARRAACGGPGAAAPWPRRPRCRARRRWPRASRP